MPRRRPSRRPPADSGPARDDRPVWLVLGLGNPGPTYAEDRHNVGHKVVAELAERAGERFTAPGRLRAQVADTRLVEGGAGLGGIGPAVATVVLAQPRTFMNESGAAAAALTRYYKVPAQRLVVVHDELDLDFGRLRVKSGGGDNGHNGLRSIRSALGTGDYLRVRFGIGRPPGRQDPADFVLTPFPASLRTDLAVAVSRAADAVECLLTRGLDETQNRFNG